VIGVLGTTTMDLIISGMASMPRFDGDEFKNSSLTYCGRPLKLMLGGNGANSAYVLAALGGESALLSAVGCDELGTVMLDWLEARGVCVDGVLRHSTIATATDTVIVDNQLHRMAFYHPGANEEYGFEHIPSALLDALSGVLITGYTLMPRFRPEGYSALVRHLRGRITALDIGPAIGDLATLDELRPLLPDIGYLFANAYELSACLNCDDMESGAAALLDAGAGCVVVKRGREGAVIFQRDSTTVVPGYPVTALETIGAGDSFNAGFLYAISAGADAVEAARFGNATAAQVVSGGQSARSAPTAEQVHTVMARGGV
jgi:sugar/nucleoside kinase (ribokinase family)